jgi:hypothetical protein
MNTADVEMSDVNEALVLDLVAWVAEKPRGYAEAIEAWRTSCPRLTIWEDAAEAGYLTRVQRDGTEALVVATDRGRRLLAAHGRVAPPTSVAP